MCDVLKIQNVNRKLEQTIAAYNSDFEKMGKYNKVIKKNMNLLKKQVGNMTISEQNFHDNQVISSILLSRATIRFNMQLI